MMQLRLLLSVMLLTTGVVGVADARALVTTIAGSGYSGIKDGSASEAQFMMPMGLAADARGNLLVADAAAQRIRRVLSNGVVETVAGSGAPDSSLMWVAGGYRDGDGSSAQFNHPSAVAVAPDGVIYIADTLNHCIRKIEGRTVTTFSGLQSAPGKQDGDRSRASFMYPRSLAFDRVGNLYVADFTAGLRKVSAAGEVSTLALPKDFDLHLTGVAIAPTGAVFVSNDTDIVALDSTGRELWRRIYKDPTVPFLFDLFSKVVDSTIEASRDVAGPAFALLPLSEDQLVYTDIHSHTIRLVVHGANGVGGRVLNALPTFDADNSDGGYRDGDLARAQFDVPTGLALSPDGSVAVADTGNRRIRKITSPSGLANEGPGAPSAQARPPVSDPQADRFVYLDAQKLPSMETRYYRIAYIGNSYIYWNTQWNNSLPGIVERSLLANWRAVGIPRRPRVEAIYPFRQFRFAADYIREVLAQGTVDAVIWQINIGSVQTSFDIGPHSFADYAKMWQPAVIQYLRNADRQLAAAHIPLVVVINPYGVELTPLEIARYEEVEQASPVQEFLLWRGSGMTAQLREAVRASGVPMIDLYGAFLSQEQGAHRVPFFGTTNPHFSAAGRRLAGNTVAKALAKLRPWNRYRSTATRG